MTGLSKLVHPNCFSPQFYSSQISMSISISIGFRHYVHLIQNLCKHWPRPNSIAGRMVIYVCEWCKQDVLDYGPVLIAMPYVVIFYHEKK
jgi:hypothetical protein